MAISTAPSIEVSGAMMVERMAAHLDGKPAESSKLVSATVREVVGKNIAQFVVCPLGTIFVCNWPTLRLPESSSKKPRHAVHNLAGVF
jgi:hypothetical protein